MQFVLLIAFMLIVFAILASACKPSPCLNGGRCVKGRLRSSFTCKCPVDYSGRFCQVGNRLLLNLFISFYFIHLIFLAIAMAICNLNVSEFASSNFTCYCFLLQTGTNLFLYYFKGLVDYDFTFLMLVSVQCCGLSINKVTTTLKVQSKGRYVLLNVL